MSNEVITWTGETSSAPLPISAINVQSAYISGNFPIVLTGVTGFFTGVQKVTFGSNPAQFLFVDPTGATLHIQPLALPVSEVGLSSINITLANNTIISVPFTFLTTSIKGILTEINSGYTPASQAFYGQCLGNDGNLWWTTDGGVGAPNPGLLWKSTNVGVGTSFIAHTGGNIIAGMGGNIWAQDTSANTVIKCTPSGTVSFITLPDSSGYQMSPITIGPDARIWQSGFNMSGSTGALWATADDGTVSKYNLPTGVQGVGTMICGIGVLYMLDGNNNGNLYSINPSSGMVTFVGTVPNCGGSTGQIKPLPDSMSQDGRLCSFYRDGFTDYTLGICFIDPTNPINTTLYPFPFDPVLIGRWFTIGADGNVWATVGILDGSLNPVSSTIYRCTLAGTMTPFSVPVSGTNANGDFGCQGICVGSDGLIYTNTNGSGSTDGKLYQLS